MVVWWLLVVLVKKNGDGWWWALGISTKHIPKLTCTSSWPVVKVEEVEAVSWFIFKVMVDLDLDRDFERPDERHLKLFKTDLEREFVSFKKKNFQLMVKLEFLIFFCLVQCWLKKLHRSLQQAFLGFFAEWRLQNHNTFMQKTCRRDRVENCSFRRKIWGAILRLVEWLIQRFWVCLIR